MILKMMKPKCRQKVCNPREALKKALFDFLSKYSDIVPDDIPSKWEKHGDLILLPANSFQNPIWKKYELQVWNIVCNILKCQKIARKYQVKDDDFRSPNVELLRGSDGWVIHIDNKIKYSYDVTKCMFSAGNITEKLRIAQFSCEGETVVDLYAGIGYFTLPYLVHAKASFVHACEWNPHAVEALKKNLIINGVQDKCSVHFGDNRVVCPEKIADRVNLGLIPSSEDAWETACNALKPSGGILHVHGNVTSRLNHTDDRSHESEQYEWNKWSHHVISSFRHLLFTIYESNWNVSLLKINRVKSYAPHINHLVVDIECRPDIY